MAKKFLVGIFSDEDVLLKAVKAIRDKGVKIHEVYSPFPVHGLDEALGYRRSRLPIAAFMFGCLGFSLALIMQFYMMHFDWPMIIGGKNTYSVTFVPITFELSVLISSLGMVGTFFVVADLKPYKKVKLFDKRCTDDKHVMAINLQKNTMSEAELTDLLTASGAEEVNSKEV